MTEEEGSARPEPAPGGRGLPWDRKRTCATGAATTERRPPC